MYFIVIVSVLHFCYHLHFFQCFILPLYSLLQGYCGWTLATHDRLLIPGNADIGILHFKNHYYTFVSKEAALEFASDPDRCTYLGPSFLFRRSFLEIFCEQPFQWPFQKHNRKREHLNIQMLKQFESLNRHANSNFFTILGTFCRFQNVRRRAPS